jgi:DNA-binding beta-propeller fold protein YncE
MNRREFVVGAVTLPLALRFAPEALAGGTPAALVTADTQARVVAVELSTGKILRSIPTLPGPRSIESVNLTTGVVCHTARGAVSLIDGPKLRVREVLRGFSEPRYAAVRPGGAYVYISDSAREEVVVVDVASGKVVGRLSVGGPARHLSVGPGGRLLWVSLGSKAERIAIVDVSNPTRPRVKHHLFPPFLAHDVGFARGGRHVWVSSGDRGALAVYDVRTGTVLRPLPGDAPPQHVTFHRGNAYVTSGDDGSLRVHSLRDGRLLRTTRVPFGSYNVQEAWGRILTPSLQNGAFSVLDRHGRIERRIQIAPSSHDACFVVTA